MTLQECLVAETTADFRLERLGLISLQYFSPTSHRNMPAAKSPPLASTATLAEACRLNFFYVGKAMPMLALTRLI